MKILAAAVLLFCVSASRSQGVWTQKASFPAVGREEATCFSCNGRAYFGTGVELNGVRNNDLWEYDPVSNTWSPKDTIPGARRFAAISFSIGLKGYTGTGIGSSLLQDFWEYDVITGAWSQKANFSGSPRYGAIGFSIGGKGYAGTGYSSSGYCQDFYEYDPTLNQWTPKANFPGGPRSYAFGFSIGNLGYAGTGTNGNCQTDTWEYDPGTNQWTLKAPFPGGARMTAASFVINSIAYVGTGWTQTQGAIDDFYSFDPVTNTWQPIASFPANREGSNFTSINQKGYLGNGNTGLGPNYQTDWWEFDPSAPLGIPEEESTISFFYNAVNEVITVTSSGNEENILSVMDVNGKKCIVKHFTSHEDISTSCLAAGVYFLEVTGGGKVFSKKILIQ